MQGYKSLLFITMKNPDYLTKLSAILEIPVKERESLKEVTDIYSFKTNEYYNSLINWDDPDDPIRKIVIPHKDELKTGGKLDASDESKYMVAPGVEHKYSDTALFIVTDVCGAYCRFCFRKRLFMKDNDEKLNDISGGMEYIKNHPEINNVLITGEYSLIVGTEKFLVLPLFLEFNN